MKFLFLFVHLGIPLVYALEPPDFTVNHVSQHEHCKECSIHEGYSSDRPPDIQPVDHVADNKAARTEDDEDESKEHLPTHGDKMFESGLFHEDALANELARHRRALEIISSFKGEITEDMPSGHTQIVWNPRAMPRLQKVKTEDYSTRMGDGEYYDNDDQEAEEGEETKFIYNKMPNRPQSDNKSWCDNYKEGRHCVPEPDASKMEKKEWMAMAALHELLMAVKGKNGDGDNQY
ncbi:hypothetical protein ACHAPU_011135 [Fusarium lateritium]